MEQALRAGRITLAMRVGRLMNDPEASTKAASMVALWLKEHKESPVEDNPFERSLLEHSPTILRKRYRSQAGMAAELARRSDSQSAYQLLGHALDDIERIDEGKPFTSSLSVLCQGLTRVLASDPCRALFDRVLKISAGIHDSEYRVEALLRCIEGLMKGGEIERAHAAIRYLKMGAARSKALARLAAIEIREGLQVQGRESFRQALEEIRLFMKRGQEIVVSEIVETEDFPGRRDLLMTLLRDAGHQGDDVEKAKKYFSVVEAISEDSQPDSVEVLQAAIPLIEWTEMGNDYRDKVRGAMAQVAARSGDVEQALLTCASHKRFCCKQKRSPRRHYASAA